MSELEQYRTDVLEEVKATAAQGEFTHEAFVGLMSAQAPRGRGAQAIGLPVTTGEGTPSQRARDGWLSAGRQRYRLLGHPDRGGAIVAGEHGSMANRSPAFLDLRQGTQLRGGRLSRAPGSSRPHKAYFDLADWLSRNRNRISSIRLYVLTDTELNVKGKELPTKTVGTSASRYQRLGYSSLLQS